MKNTIKLSLALLVVSSVFMVSCSKTSTATTTDCTGVAPTYNADIKAIMTANCTLSGCHNSSAAGGYNLTTYEACKNAKDKIVGSVQHVSGYQAMPQGSGKLDDSTITKIFCWAQNGCMQ
ncbi:MAG: hypothetical protein NT150_13780 [Bacteroidetes bacterium]|nr:hypothetical protein [Bacteroidota bacterium]